MNHIISIGEWVFEIKSIRALRTESYGEPYDAIAMIEIVDGEAHVEGAFTQAAWMRKDNLTIESALKTLGFSQYTMSRFKRGKRVIIKKEIA